MRQFIVPNRKQQLLFAQIDLESIAPVGSALRTIDATTHLGYRWLTGDAGIDHSTMGKFLSRYKELIVELFSQVVEIGIENELIDFDISAMDSVKIRANASYKQFRTLKKMNEEKKKIRDRSKELIEKADEESTEEREA